MLMHTTTTTRTHSPAPPAAVGATPLPPIDPAAPCPLILTDTREQAPLPFEHFPTTRTMLQTGDYSAHGMQDLLAIERKSIPDLLRSITQERERFTKELARLRCYPTRALLIVGTHADMKAALNKREINLEALKGTLANISALYCPLICTPTPQEAAARIESLAWYIWRDIRRRAGLKNPPTPPWAREHALQEMLFYSTTNK